MGGRRPRPERGGRPGAADPGGPITAVVDCRDVIGAKYAALGAHASQLDNACFLEMGLDAYARVFAVEAYRRAGAVRPGAVPGPAPGTDLFAGLR